MKTMTTALLAAFVLGTISTDVMARGGRGGGGKRSHASHASSGNYGGSQAGDGVCHTGPRGGRYTITPSGRKKYGC